MGYSTKLVANNILNRSFAEKYPITPMRLQRILYIVACEYQQATGNQLLEEQFSTWKYGPVLYSAFDHFRCFGNTEILRFARDPENRTRMVNEAEDVTLRCILDTVWGATKRINIGVLCDAVRTPGSAWDVAFQAEKPFLDPKDVAVDTGHRASLQLPPAW